MSSHQIIKKGPVIGQYENRPIYEYLVYSDGRVIEFAHVARAERDGQFRLSNWQTTNAWWARIGVPA